VLTTTLRRVEWVGGPGSVSPGFPIEAFGNDGLLEVWSSPLRSKLREIKPTAIEAQDFIARDNLSAAAAVARRIWDAATKLCDNPNIGRKGHVSGTREWVVTETPYLMVYRVKNDALELLRVWHGRVTGKPILLAKLVQMSCRKAGSPDSAQADSCPQWPGHAERRSRTHHYICTLLAAYRPRQAFTTILAVLR
jgi:plasmid stabilization system protein ParE